MWAQPLWGGASYENIVRDGPNIISGTVNGDIVATGTNHRGLNPFMDGDRIEMECEGLGRLAINIRDDLKRKWDRVTRLEHEKRGLPGAHTPQISGKYLKEPA